MNLRPTLTSLWGTVGIGFDLKRESTTVFAKSFPFIVNAARPDRRPTHA